MGFINRTIRPDILILLETMVNAHNVELIVRNLASTVLMLFFQKTMLEENMVSMEHD